MIWTLKGLMEHANETHVEIEGHWVPARPINYLYDTLFQRVRYAWMVMRGKAEAFTWPMGQ